MIGVDRNGRDDGGRREDLSLTYFPSFHFLFLYFLAFSFFFPSLVLFIIIITFFKKYFQNFRRIYMK